MDTKSFDVKITNEKFRTKVEINGEEIKCLHGIKFEHESGELPILTLKMSPRSVMLDGEMVCIKEEH